MLQFISGATSIPQTGFDFKPSITFDDTIIYPMASTCALQLTLPLRHAAQEVFEEKMVYGILFNGGFGLY